MTRFSDEYCFMSSFVLHLLLAVEIRLVCSNLHIQCTTPSLPLMHFWQHSMYEGYNNPLLWGWQCSFLYIPAVEEFLFFICFHDRCYSCTCSLCDEPLFSTRKSECLNGSWHDLCTATSTKTSSTSSYIYMYHKTTKFGLCQMLLTPLMFLQLRKT